MITLTVTKATNKATVNFDGKDVELRVIPVNKAGVKPGTHWVDLQKLGTPKKWQTVNYVDQKEDVFTVEVDETAARKVSPRKSRIISLSNIKDFLNDEQKEQIDELVKSAEAERDRQAEEAAKNAPVKEKRSRAMTPEQKLAKKLAEVEELKKIISGEIPAPAPKKAKKKAAAVENLDEGTAASGTNEEVVDKA